MRERILKAALKAAEEYGYNKVTREQIAEAGKEDGITASNVQYHLHKAERTRRLIVLAAIETRNYRVLAQAMALGDELFLEKSSIELRKRVVMWLDSEYCRGV